MSRRILPVLIGCGIGLAGGTAAFGGDTRPGSEAAVERGDAGLARFVGVNAFTRLELLPLLRDGVQTRQFCSYDRAGDNYDWEYFPLYFDDQGQCVIFDAMGPGCLYRHHMNIWNGKAIEKGIRIRYYFDDEPSPRIDMDVSTFFSEKNPLGIFRPPLAYDGKNRFRVMYHPMAFRKRLKVALSAEPGGLGSGQGPWEGHYEKIPQRRDHWYIYTYHTFTEDPGVDSWTPEAGRQSMPALVAAWSNLGEIPRSVQVNKQERVERSVEAGKTATLARLDGAGSIGALRVSVEPADERSLFDTWIRITFDGAGEPQVEAPIGCFFGAYRTSIESSFASLMLGFSKGVGYCYLPMPFWESAVVEVQNRGPRATGIELQIEQRPLDVDSFPRRQCGHLFARYHREDPRTEGKDYTYLETAGAGHVVGHTVARWDTSMEENERTYFDGSGTPQINGDGFEDDHGMGWGLQNLIQPVFGAIGASGGEGSIYRFCIPDTYHFSSRIKHGHQSYGPNSPRGHAGMYRVGGEESVTFFYASTRPRLVQTDELDVGRADSEAAHDYAAQGDVQRTQGRYWYDGEFNNVLLKTPAIADDGVSFTGQCTFTVAVSPQNQGVRLRRRIDKENNRQLARVSIDGRLVTERLWYSVDYEKTYRDIRWLDSDFEVPAAYTRGKDRVSVRIEFVGSETGRWDEYRYWVYSYVNPGGAYCSDGGK